MNEFIDTDFDPASKLCGSCKFLEAMTGQCHYMPPPWPDVASDDWCGQWSPSAYENELRLRWEIDQRRTQVAREERARAGGATILRQGVVPAT